MNRFRPFVVPALFATIALGVAGCSNAGKVFGLTITPPDAFDVATEAPLSMPPEMAVLPKPVPGEPRPQQVSSSQQAEALLTPSSVTNPTSAAMGPGQQALLQQAGPPPPANIRADVNSEAGLTSKPSSFVSDLMFWKPANAGSGAATVNASAEEQRLQENAALGVPATSGATAPVPESKPGLWGRFINLF